MNFVKAIAIAMLVASGAALMGSGSARAQTSAPSPTPPSERWAALNCDELFAAIRARRSMTPDQLSKVQPLRGSWAREHDWEEQCLWAVPPPSPKETYPSP